MSSRTELTRSALTCCARMRRARLRELLIAAAVIAAVAAGLFLKLTRHPTDLLVGVHSSGRNDLTSYFLRSADTPVVLQNRFDEWSDWNPSLALGLPVHGNPQAEMFYPPNWLAWAFGAERTLSWLMVGHLWLGGLGVWLLARHIGLGRGAALVGAVSATGAPCLVAHLAEGHVAQLFTVAWVPWILLAFERFLDSDGRHWRMIPLGVALSFLAGHVQELYYLLLLLCGSVILAAVRRCQAGNRTAARSLLVHWLLAGGLSAGLVCCDLIPVWLNSRLSVRSGQLPLDVAGDGLTLAHLRQLLDPLALNTPEDTASKYGFYWTKLFHFGVIPLLLASLAVLTQWKRPQTRRLFWMLVIAVLFAFGTATPVFRVLYRVMPLLGSFRVPTRILFLCSFFVALLAALGVETLSGRRFGNQTAGKRATDDRAAGDGITGNGTRAGLLAGILIAAGVGFELWKHADRVLATAEPSALRSSSQVSRFLQQSGAADPATPCRVLAWQDLYSDIESFQDGVQRVRGYEPVPQMRLAWAIDALFNVPDGQLDFAGFHDCDLASLNPAVADLLGIRFLVTGREQPDVPGWQRVATGRVLQPVRLRGAASTAGARFQIFENVDVLPRAFVAGRTVTWAGLDVQQRIEQLSQLDPRNTVQLDADVLPDGPRSEFVAARIDDYRADHVNVTVALDAPGYLVLTDLYHPGWTATVDGQATEILPADLALRAVPLSAGRHVIEFRYRCPGQTLGLALSAMSMLALLLSAAAAHRRCNGPRQPPGEP